MDLSRALAAGFGGIDDDDDQPKVTLEGMVSDLVARARQWAEPTHHFKVGDLVRQKDGLTNYRWPTSRRPGVVLEILDPPVIETTADNGHFRAARDLLIGIVCSNGDFATYPAESRRLELFVAAMALRDQET